MANTIGKVKIGKEEIEEINTMFLDAKSSAIKLKANEANYLR